MMIARNALIVLALFGLLSPSAAPSEKYEVVKVWPEAPHGWHFYRPDRVVVDDGGNVYVVESSNRRVKKFDCMGRLITQWGSPSEPPGAFGTIGALKVDSSGIIHALHRGDRRIQKYTTSGKLIGEWERKGGDAGDFKLALDLAVDSDGNVFVLAFEDSWAGRCRVEKYTPEGKLIAHWGTRGGGDGEFYGPQRIGVDADGNVYVVDKFSHRIQKFNPNGNFLMKWGAVQRAGARGDEDGLLWYPRSMAFGSKGDVYVVDMNFVQRFTPNGEFLTKWAPKAHRCWDIAVGASGNAYIADDRDHSVVKLDPEGNLIEKWGSAGIGDGRFITPGAIAVDATGTIFVVDVRNSRVQKFNSEGEFLSKWGTVGLDTIAYGMTADASGNVYVLGLDDVQKFASDGKFITKWRVAKWEAQHGDRDLYKLSGIAVDRSGNVYVADADNHRVKKYRSDGVFVAEWGTKGTDDGQFTYPTVMGLDESGNILVVDYRKGQGDRIQRFDTQGKFLTKWTVPRGIGAVDPAGNAYRAAGWTVEKYDPTGKLVAKWDAGDYVYSNHMRADASGCIYLSEGSAIKKIDSSGKVIANWKVEGVEDWEAYPSWIAVDVSGNVYAADYGSRWVWKLDPDGKLAGKFRLESPARLGDFQRLGGLAVDPAGNICVVESVHANLGDPRIQKFDPNGKFITQFAGHGAAEAEFKLPVSIAVDGSGNSYVTDKWTHCVCEFDPQGKFIKSWGSKGTDDGQFDTPEGIAVDKSGNVFVCDRQNCRIQKFDSDGTFLTKWGKQGSGDGEFHFPAAVAVDKEGNVYVADTDNHRIQKFTDDGQFVTEWGELGEDPGQLNVPLGIAVDASGNVFVSDSHNHRIQKFAPVSSGDNAR
ncbi:MAG: 6-bladed beta-propeller [Planctomycetota bacterium]|jgi:DNA-binding beta-propeller fold protein YncE